MTATATAGTEPSSKRTEANRKNAKRSTGPRTTEGKSRIRLNAMKHGLTAATVVLPGENAEALQARVDFWKDDYEPQSAMEDYLVERAAHISWQIDRADRTIAARLTDLMRFGEADQLTDEADDVADLARRLFWDPRGPLPLYPHFRGLRSTPRISWPETVEDPLNPARIVNQLERTVTGCRWLLARWGDLKNLLDRGLDWQAPDRFKAVRLLGGQPMEAPDDDRLLMIYLACNAMTPGSKSFNDLKSELDDGEAGVFAERVNGRKADELKPATPEAGKAALLAVIAHAVTRLEILLVQREERHALEFAGRLESLTFDDSAEGERLRRYQLALSRAMLRIITTIHQVRKQLALSACQDAFSLDGCPNTEPAPAVAPVFADDPAVTEPGQDVASMLAMNAARIKAAGVVGRADETNPMFGGVVGEGWSVPGVIGRADETNPMGGLDPALESRVDETNPIPDPEPVVAACSEPPQTERSVDPIPPIPASETPAKAIRAAAELVEEASAPPSVLLQVLKVLSAPTVVTDGASYFFGEGSTSRSGRPAPRTDGQPAGPSAARTS